MNVATADNMRALGRALGAALRTTGSGALVIGIEGELGAGKTRLVCGILAALKSGRPTKLRIELRVPGNYVSI